MAISKRHDDWRAQVIEDIFMKWWGENWAACYGDFELLKRAEPTLATAIHGAFVFGLEGVNHDMNALTMSDCGQEDCYDCRGQYMDDEPGMGYYE
jgi:hypothetical protein